MRFLRCAFVTLIIGVFCFSVPVIGFQSQGGEGDTAWTISDPQTESPMLIFSGDIAATGGVGYAASYTLRVVLDFQGSSTILSSVSGYGEPETWSNTVPEPQSGWPVPEGVPSRPVVLELRVSGELEGSSKIRISA